MLKIEEKMPTGFTEAQEEEINDMYDVRKRVMQIDSAGLKDHISIEYKTALFNDKDKEYVLEMSDNGFILRQMLYNMANNLDAWNKYWLQPDIATEHEKYTAGVKRYGDVIFDKFMHKLNLLAVVSHNKPNNNMVRWLLGIGEEEGIKEKEEEKVKKSIFDIFKKKKKKPEEDDE